MRALFTIAPLFLASALIASAAAAQDDPPVAEVPAITLARGLAEATTVWERREPASFVAGTIDLGYLYARTRLFAGYGRPHFLWAGVELAPVATGSRVGGYAALRLETPYLTVHAGARYTYGLNRTYLAPQERYVRQEIELRNGPHPSYWTFELEAAGSLPLGPGSVLWLGTLAYVVGIPEGRYVFEEALHVAIDPPWVLRGRLGYVFSVAVNPPIAFGPAVEVVHNPGRDLVVVRAGLVLSVRLFDDLELLGTVLPVVSSPDNLGLDGGEIAHLGVRWRWASGHTAWAAPEPLPPSTR